MVCAWRRLRGELRVQTAAIGRPGGCTAIARFSKCAVSTLVNVSLLLDAVSRPGREGLVGWALS
eukprot:2233702-Alexandrium_andersonii.AAC.1